MMKILFLSLLFLTFSQCGECAKILGVFPTAGKSLNILYEKLMLTLADQGHEVTMISAYDNKFEVQGGTFRNILLPGFLADYEYMMEHYDPYSMPEGYGLFESKNMYDLISDTLVKTFKAPEVRKLIKSDEKFDAVIIEHLWSDSVKVFGQIFNCPVILFTSMGGSNPWINADIGNPLPPSYVPHYYMIGDFSTQMTFFQRVHNFVYYVTDALVHYFYLRPKHNELLRSTLENPPDVSTFYNNISLVLLGSHSSLRQATPLLPNVVEIGGFHIDPPRKLPIDLQEFLDEATEGAIYFSMGSHLRSKDFPVERINMFLNVFRKLKLKVLWKFEDEILPGKPDNVLIRKWLPQTDILAHPNIKLFIAHGGYGSVLETVYHGVPSLMLPVFFDQFNNAYQAAHHGFAIKLSFNDKHFSEATLMKLIQELLNNPAYRNSAKHRQQLFHDRPLKPLDTAVYWIEYVIRHKGADHLKVAGAKLPMLQFYSLDVISFLLINTFLVLHVIYLSVRRIIIYLRRNVRKRKTQ